MRLEHLVEGLWEMVFTIPRTSGRQRWLSFSMTLNVSTASTDNPSLHSWTWRERSETNGVSVVQNRAVRVSQVASARRQSGAHLISRDAGPLRQVDYGSSRASCDRADSFVPTDPRRTWCRGGMGGRRNITRNYVTAGRFPFRNDTRFDALATAPPKSPARGFL